MREEKKKKRNGNKICQSLTGQFNNVNEKYLNVFKSRLEMVE